MTHKEDVVFDTTSGISVEEQKEILSKINGIAEKNRQQLSSGEKQLVKAKKNSAIFPLIVNIIAILLLCGGGFFLFNLNGKIDTQVREGNAVFNLTERALIEEIRKDTADRIAAKELEISSIASRLEDVDAQLLLLYSSNIELTSEQITAEERLLAMQNAYRADLIALHDDRSRILEDSRLREARLRAQLEERTRELAAAQMVSGELDAAINELEQLTREQERAAAIEAQFLGGLAAVSVFVQNGQYDQAVRALENLGYFINSSAFSSSRAFQNKREIYNQIIDSMEVMVTMLAGTDDLEVGRENWELQVRNIQLEEAITEMQRTIDTFNEGSTGQERRLNELEASVTNLRNTNSALQTSGAEKDRTITSLESERTTLTRTVTELQTANTAQDQEISNLRNQIEIIRQALLDN